jgi:hypothetical protein
MGLAVERLEPDDAAWIGYWKLYCLQRFAVDKNEKLFESDYVSLAS